MSFVVAVRRKHITLTEKLASALMALGYVPYADAKQMTAHQFISLFQFDHNILHTHDGSDEFWNLTPMLILTHRVKTKRDARVIAKVRKLTKGQEETRRILLKPTAHKRERSSRWPKRPMRRAT